MIELQGKNPLKFYSRKSHPDFDARSGGSTQPVSVRAEAQGIDNATSVQGVQVLAFVKIPQHSIAILETYRTTSQNGS